ncbi:MAG: hypothetical protein GY856_54185, partial [bacterium]|nr:hypothetical protein [bacterium]
LLPPGRVMSVGGRSLVVDHELGQGMMAVSYAVRCRESGQPYALKRARARFDLFRQILTAEAEASRRLPELVGLPTARVVAEDEESLLKERYDAPTLQALIVDGALAPAHRKALVATLERGKELLDAYGFHADLSPKNLCWCDDHWVLLDTGEPLVANAFAESVLQRISWDAFLAFYAPKIRSRDSQPSALTVAARPDELDLGAATRYAFVREWWLWLPCVDEVVPGLLRATFDAAARDDEILFFMEQDGGGWHLRAAARGDPGTVTPELAMERAVDQWRRSFPDRPCSPPAIPELDRDCATTDPDVGWAMDDQRGKIER